MCIALRKSVEALKVARPSGALQRCAPCLEAVYTGWNGVQSPKGVQMESAARHDGELCCAASPTCVTPTIDSCPYDDGISRWHAQTPAKAWTSRAMPAPRGCQRMTERAAESRAWPHKMTPRVAEIQPRRTAAGFGRRQEGSLGSKATIRRYHGGSRPRRAVPRGIQGVTATATFDPTRESVLDTSRWGNGGQALSPSMP